MDFIIKLLKFKNNINRKKNVNILIIINKLIKYFYLILYKKIEYSKKLT